MKRRMLLVVIAAIIIILGAAFFVPYLSDEKSDELLTSKKIVKKTIRPLPTQESPINVLTPGQKLGDTLLEKLQDDATDAGLGNSVGNRIAMGRTRDIIRSLKLESIEGTLAHLDRVSQFYYPGFMPEGFSPQPLDQVHLLLSNRRFVKLLNDMESLDRSQRAQRLGRWIEHYRSQYTALLERFQEEHVKEVPLGYSEAFRISDDPSLGPTLQGTKLAIRSLILVAGMTGTTELQSVIRELVVNGIYEQRLDRSRYDPDFLRKLDYDTLLSDSFVAQTMHQMARNSEESRATRFPRREILTAAKGHTVAVEVLDYRAEVSQYDVLHRAGAKLDISQGSRNV